MELARIWFIYLYGVKIGKPLILSVWVETV